MTRVLGYSTAAYSIFTRPLCIGICCIAASPVSAATLEFLDGSVSRERIVTASDGPSYFNFTETDPQETTLDFTLDGAGLVEGQNLSFGFNLSAVESYDVTFAQPGRSPITFTNSAPNFLFSVSEFVPSLEFSVEFLDLNGNAIPLVQLPSLGTTTETAILQTSNGVNVAAQFLEANSAVEPEGAVAVVAIDFSNATPLSLEQAISQFDGNEYIYLSDDGTAPKAFIPDQSALIGSVQEIFDRSDVGITVVDAADVPESVDSLVTVHFLPTDTPGPLGNAYDVRSDEFEGLGYVISGGDRFDRDKDGNVVIFKDQNTLSLENLARTIAHEAGHGFGLHHVDDQTTPAEVMDYSFDPSVPEVFSGQPLQTELFEGEPGDSLIPTEAFRVDVYSQFHLRSYALEEDFSFLINEEGLIPGRYDIGNIEYALWTLDLSALDERLSWYISEEGHDAELGGGNFVTNINSSITDRLLSILIPAGSEFQLFASRENTFSIDVVIGASDDGDVTTLLSSGAMLQELSAYDWFGAAPRELASIGTSFGGIWEDDPSGINTISPNPLPSSLVQLLAAIAAISALAMIRSTRMTRRLMA